MARGTVTPRSAVREDAPALAELWSDVLRRADRSEQIADLELIIKSAATSPELRVVVVEYDGEVAGAVYLRLTTMSPLNLEMSVQSIHPRVFDRFRSHGVGRALVEVAASFAEENGILHLGTAVPATARDANRFMARLGFAPAATFRVAPTSLVRNRLTPPRPAGQGGNGRNVRVLAARRSMRRVRAASDLGELPGFVEPVAPE